MSKTYKIAITGPESTGKTELTKALASHYNAIYTAEYAREYLQSIGRDYIEADLHIMANEQWKEQQEDIQKASDIYIADTEMIVYKVWYEVKYGFAPIWIENYIKKQDFDLYLLCDIDLAWEDDPLREHPHQREFLLEKYKATFKAFSMSYELISGKGVNRIKNAINCIKKNIK